MVRSHGVGIRAFSIKLRENNCLAPRPPLQTENLQFLCPFDATPPQHNFRWRVHRRRRLVPHRSLTAQSLKLNCTGDPGFGRGCSLSVENNSLRFFLCKSDQSIFEGDNPMIFAWIAMLQIKAHETLRPLQKASYPHRSRAYRR